MKITKRQISTATIAGLILAAGFMTFNSADSGSSKNPQDIDVSSNSIVITPSVARTVLNEPSDDL